MRQHVIFLFQLFLFALYQTGRLQFVELKPEIVFVLAVAADGLTKLLEVLPHRHESLVGCPVVGDVAVVMGDDVDDAELEVLLMEEQVLVLAVDVHQLGTQFAHGGQGDGGVVDESAALARNGDLTAQDAIAGVVVEVFRLEEVFEVIAAQVKMGLDDAAVGAALDRLDVGPLS